MHSSKGNDILLEDEDNGESLYEFVREQIDKFFIENLPVDYIKELPNGYLYYFGTVSYLMAGAMFIYFVYINYQANANQAYISLSQDSGCDSVPIAINGNYLADRNGNWVGTPDFAESQAVYSFGFSNFEVNTVDQYTRMMSTFYSSLQTIGRFGVDNTIAENLILWMVYKRYYSLQDPASTQFSAIGYGQLQTLTLTGTPSNVFNLPYVLSRLASRHGVCTATSVASQDPANHRLVNSYANVTQLLANSACRTAVNPAAFGYHTQAEDSLYTIQLDTMSFATAMGVNLGYLDVANLRPVQSVLVNFTVNDTSYTLGEYFNADYANMNSIYCMQNVTAVSAAASYRYALPTALCFIDIGTTLTLPVFNHYGGSTSSPNYCSCSNGEGRSEACQSFDLLAGLVFFPAAKSPPSDATLERFFASDHRHHPPSPANITNLLEYFGLFDLVQTAGRYSSYKQFNAAAYNASFYTVNTNTNTNTNTNSANDLSDAFAFCATSSTSSTTSSSSTKECSLAMFHVSDFTSRTVSEYKFQLFNGSCSDSFAIASDTFAQLVSNPPVQFTQLYFECYQDSLTALVGSVGIAFGNTQLFIPVLVLVALPVLYAFLVAIRQVPAREEYRALEKEEVLGIFALLLLRLRDGKTRGLKRRGVLRALANELIAAAKEEGGYPDSDDEEEEDEDDGINGNSGNSGNGNNGNGNTQQHQQTLPVTPYERDDESMVSSYHTGKGNGNNGNNNPNGTGNGNGNGNGTRRKLAVFTKHLKPANTGTNTGRASWWRGSEMSVSYGGNADGNREVSIDSYRQSVPMFSFFSSGPQSGPKPVRQQELTTLTGNNSTRYRSIYRQGIPVSVVLLNVPNDWLRTKHSKTQGSGGSGGGNTGMAQWQEVTVPAAFRVDTGNIHGNQWLREEEIDWLLDDLTKQLAECVALHSQLRHNTGNNTSNNTGNNTTNNTSNNTGNVVVRDSDDEEEEEPVTTDGNDGNTNTNTTTTHNPLQPPSNTNSNSNSNNNNSNSNNNNNNNSNSNSSSSSNSNEYSEELQSVWLRAQQLSQRLLLVSLDQLLQRDDENRTVLFLKLNNLMLMHGSVRLDCAMFALRQQEQEAAQPQAQHVAYVLGEHVVTAQDIHSLIL